MVRQPESPIFRGTKRSSEQSGPHGNKKRAPYALRACEACRRRKGKCDGRQPCGHCTSRKWECCFPSLEPEQQDNSPQVAVELSQTHAQKTPGSASRPDATRSRAALSRDGRSATSYVGQDPNGQGESLVDLVSSLQGQIDGLSSQRESTDHRPRAVNPLTPSDDSHHLIEAFGGDDEHGGHAAGFGQSRRASSGTVNRYFGPTSPDYSFNMAQMRLRHEGASTTSTTRQTLPTLQDEVASEAESEAESASPSRNNTSGARRQSLDRGQNDLLKFRSILTLQDVVRLLLIYADVVGEFHAIVDVDHLVSKARFWYSRDSSGGLVQNDAPDGENMLLILNLSLAVALRADSHYVISDVERSLQASFQPALNARVAGAATGVKDVTVVLLAGIYDFFRDISRRAWRMCGIAGRMLMELGLHNGEVSQAMLRSEPQRREVAVLMCSIVVLDRQWSAAAGLPNNFVDSNFDPIPKSLVTMPYLKAMLSFILVSDKFSEPISHTAKGSTFEDRDTLEVLDLQIEQWRRKSVGSLPVSQPETWLAEPTSRPPSWAILLSLRAESVRSLILRPCFLPGSDRDLARLQLVPAIELISRSTQIMFALDSTEIYRQQHPCYQHILASVCCLFFLMIAHVDSNPDLLSSDLPDGFSSAVDLTFYMAATLSGKYAKTSRAARRLWDRFSEIRQTVSRLGLLSTRTLGLWESYDDLPSGAARSHLGATTVEENAARALLTWSGPPLATPSTDPAPGPTPYQDFVIPQPQVNTSQLGWTESFLFDWPIDDGMTWVDDNTC